MAEAQLVELVQLEKYKSSPQTVEIATRHALTKLLGEGRLARYDIEVQVNTHGNMNDPVTLRFVIARRCGELAGVFDWEHRLVTAVVSLQELPESWGQIVAHMENRWDTRLAETLEAMREDAHA